MRPSLCFTSLPRLRFPLATLLALWGCAEARSQNPFLSSGGESFTEPYRRIEVAPAEPGCLAAIYVREGDWVQPGQKLALLDDGPLKISLESAQLSYRSTAKLEAAQAELALRQSRSDRLQELHQRGHATSDEVAKAEMDLQSAIANVAVARHQRALDEVECRRITALLERRSICSPVQGVVVRVIRDVQEYVSVSSPAVMVVAQLDKLRVTFSLPTAQAATLKPSQAMRVVFTDSNTQAEGTIESIGSVTDPESGTVRVRIVIENPEGKYRSGVRCRLDTP